MKKIFLVLFLLVALPGFAQAECECRCVQGKVIPVCSIPTEHRPRCVQHACPITRAAEETIQAPDKNGTCSEQPIRNPFTGLTETKTICQ